MKIDFKIVAVSLAVANLFVAGCDRNGSKGSLEVADGKQTWEDLQPEDIVVKINGHEIKKADLEDMNLLHEAIVSYKVPSASREQVKKMSLRSLPRAMMACMTRYLFLDEAERVGVSVTEDDEILAKDDFLRQFGVERRPKFDAFRGKLDSRIKNVLDSEIRDNARVQALFRVSFPKEYVVASNVVAELAADVVDRNRRAKIANEKALKKAQAALARIKAGEDFSAVAEEVSEVPRENDGLWDEFHPEDLEQYFPEIFEAVSKLTPGGVTDVLELDDAIHIVSLLGRKGSGRRSIINSDPEVWTLGEIVVKLPMYFKAAPPQDVIAHQRAEQLAPKKNEMFAKFRELAKIEYPHGTNIWSKIARPVKRRQPK